MKGEERAPETPRRRVLLVDDHPVVRFGMARLLAEAPDLTLCGEANDAEAAIDLLATSKPDVAIVDISLRGTSGIDLVRRIKRDWPAIAILVVSMHDEAIYAERALHAGASGYVTKQEAMDVLVRAVRRVLEGEMFVSDAMSGRLLSRVMKAGAGGGASSTLGGLSDREYEVLRLIGQGHGTRAIAETLGISVKTVETHRAHLKSKIRLRTSTELAQYAAVWVKAGEEGGR